MYFIYLSSHILLNRELYKKMTEKEKRERERERERERGTSLVAKNNG